MHDTTKSMRCNQDIGLVARKVPRVESLSNDAHTVPQWSPMKTISRVYCTSIYEFDGNLI
jgi:hypothetical protein